MPCVYYTDDQMVQILRKEKQELKQELEIAMKELNRTTEILCDAGKAYYNCYTPKRRVLDWWREHKKRDEELGQPWE